MTKQLQQKVNQQQSGDKTVAAGGKAVRIGDKPSVAGGKASA